MLVVLKEAGPTIVIFQVHMPYRALATYQLKLPDTTCTSKSYTAILCYYYSPAYYVTTIAAAYGVPSAFIEAGKAKAMGGPSQTFPGTWVQGRINNNNITQCLV